MGTKTFKSKRFKFTFHISSNDILNIQMATVTHARKQGFYFEILQTISEIS
jgi:hypothetical protein